MRTARWGKLRGVEGQKEYDFVTAGRSISWLITVDSSFDSGLGSEESPLDFGLFLGKRSASFVSDFILG